MIFSKSINIIWSDIFKFAGLPMLDEVTKKAPKNLVADFGDHIR